MSENAKARLAVEEAEQVARDAAEGEDPAGGFDRVWVEPGRIVYDDGAEER
jgi:hypothetical protein